MKQKKSLRRNLEISVPFHTERQLGSRKVRTRNIFGSCAARAHLSDHPLSNRVLLPLLQRGRSAVFVTNDVSEWLADDFPQSHRKVQQAMRILVDEVVFEDAQERELDGKRVSQSVLDEMAYVHTRTPCPVALF